MTVFKDARSLIVVAAVDARGAAAQAGVKPGDAVMSIGGMIVREPEALSKLMKNYVGRPIAMWRGDLSRISPRDASTFSCGDASSRETMLAHDGGRLVGYSYCWMPGAGRSP